MNDIVNEWITRLDAGETVQLGGFSEFAAAFPEISFNELLPAGITLLHASRHATYHEIR